MKTPRIALLYGGVSRERDVSLGSGHAAGLALEKFFAVDRFDVRSYSRLPDGLDAREHVVFSTLHGSFGEDGAIQRMMDEAGVVYAGCDAASSALTFDKVATKRALQEAGVPVADQVIFDAPQLPEANDVVAQLGESLVVKPVAQGSSVGLSFAEGAEELRRALDGCDAGRWMIEPRIAGREATVGILQGRALEIVEIRPKSGRFDYTSKYTKGLTEFVVPAEFDGDLTKRIRNLATIAFEACGCRDYARIDLMVGPAAEPCFLEINTLPGLKETSLLPQSAAACGYNFDELMQKLVEPAILRYREKLTIR